MRLVAALLLVIIAGVWLPAIHVLFYNIFLPQPRGQHTNAMSSSSSVNSPAEEATVAKSLQNLAAAKTIEVLHQDENAVQTWNSFHSATQQVLFSHIWKEFSRLRDLEHSCKAYQERRDFFGSQFRYHNTKDKAISLEMVRRGLREECTTWHLYATVDPKRPIGLCRSCNVESLYSPKTTCYRCKSTPLDILTLVSPEVFRERLAYAFGTPPKSKTIKGSRYFHPDDVCGPELVYYGFYRFRSCVFTRRGICFVTILGICDDQATECALDLLNWLITTEVPEPCKDPRRC